MTNIPKGLYLSPDVITEDEETKIIKWLDEQEWSTVLKRRTQHYGYNYEYRSKDVKRTTPMSGPILKLANRLSGIMVAEQCIVNEYYIHQGISPHIDSDAFGSVIMGLSIGSDGNMIFTRNGYEKFIAYLPRRSLIMLTDEAREHWKHSIPVTKHIVLPDGMKEKEEGYRRISLTYRTIA